MPMGLRPIPVDTKLPGEIAEGDRVAFGFPIPRAMRVTAEYPDAFYAAGKLKLEDLSNYTRDRVDAEKIETGPSRTVFLQAALRDDPKRAVEVTLVQSRGGKVTMVVRDRTRVRDEVSPTLTEEQRWERVGLTPDGKVLEKYAQ